MKSWPARALLLAGAGALLAAIPALGQNRDAPESLLPPGFGDPADAAAARGEGAGRRRAAQPAPPLRRPRPTPGLAGNLARRRRGDRARPDGAAAADQLFHHPRRRGAPDRPGRPARARQFRPRRRTRSAATAGALLRRPDAPARRALAVALDLDPAAPRLAVAASPRRPASTRSTGSPSAPPCCCGWARPTRRGCWSSRSTSNIIRRGWSRWRRRPRSPPPIRPRCARWSAPARAPGPSDPVWIARRRHVRRAGGRGGAGERADRPGPQPRPAPASTCCSPKRWSAPAPRPAARSSIEWDGVERDRSLALRPRQRHRRSKSRRR